VVANMSAPRDSVVTPPKFFLGRSGTDGVATIPRTALACASLICPLGCTLASEADSGCCPLKRGVHRPHLYNADTSCLHSYFRAPRMEYFESAKNATVGSMPVAGVVSGAYGVYAGLTAAVFVAYAYVAPFVNLVTPLFELPWVQDGLRLMLLGTIMESARQFWQRMADRVANSASHMGSRAYDLADKAVTLQASSAPQ